MQATTTTQDGSTSPSTAAWGAVFAMSLCVFVLIASEFMPVSLLSPIASDLSVSEGQAGQAISISGVFAVLTSLFLASVIGQVDRKRVLLMMTGLMLVSGTVVAVAPSYPILMIGRALLGVVIGGFWSMSTATVMRLVPEASVPKALAILNSGNALAATIAAPLGSYVGGIIGWRGAFFCVVPIAAAALIWQWITLPSLPGTATRRASPFASFRLLGRPVMALGMAAVLLMFMGQYGVYTYFRPFLESVTGVDVNSLSLMLLTVGVTGLVGTMIVGGILKRSLHAFLIGVPVGLAAIALALLPLGASVPATFVLLGLWGLVSTPSSVGWFTWLSKQLPEEAEAGGGLMIAVIQFAITLGAAGGGLLYDLAGHKATFGASALILLVAAATAGATAKLSRRS